MRRNDQGLEHILGGNSSSTQCKSMGERKIASFLGENNIKYQYEIGVLIFQAKDKPRIWYPDFYLPEFSTYIEYYGIVGDPEYDRGVRVKESTYSKMGLDVISIYPDMFPGNWRDHIIDELERKIKRQYDKLFSIPFMKTLKPDSFQNTSHYDELYIDF